MLRPPFLQAGDKVGLVAPARKVSQKEMAPAIALFKDWGLRVAEGPNLYKSQHQFSGSDDERAADLQRFFDDPETRAVICARGGYGSMRLLEKLDLTGFLAAPKWLVGYSDITALHAFLQKEARTESIHATMPLNFPNQEGGIALKSLHKTLFFGDNCYTFGPHAFNRPGEVEGELIGGNLSMLYAIQGTKYDFDYHDKILFIEDLDEYLYHIDRMMMSLHLSGKLKQIKGLIVGGMSDMNDNSIPFGYSAYQTVQRVCEAYDFPLCFNFSAGHIRDNLALILGRKIRLRVGATGCMLEMP